MDESFSRIWKLNKYVVIYFLVEMEKVCVQLACYIIVRVLLKWNGLLQGKALLEDMH